MIFHENAFYILILVNENRIKKEWLVSAFMSPWPCLVKNLFSVSFPLLAYLLARLYDIEPA